MKSIAIYDILEEKYLGNQYPVYQDLVDRYQNKGQELWNEVLLSYSMHGYYNMVTQLIDVAEYNPSMYDDYRDMVEYLSHHKYCQQIRMGNSLYLRFEDVAKTYYALKNLELCRN